MIAAPAASVLRHSSNPAWESRSSSGEKGAPSPAGRTYAHRSTTADNSVSSPADPHRQAGRLPIKLLKMLTARAGHIMHPEYLQPLPSTPISPIELDAKKSPLALLAQTCSQIGKPDPPASSKLSSVASGGDKESKAGPLKISDIGGDDKSSFKPYAKSSSCSDAKKESSLSGDKNAFRVPSATCPPFTPRTGSRSRSVSPSSCASPSASPLPCDGKAADKDDKKECERNKNTSSPESNRTSGISPDGSQESAPGSKAVTSDSPSVTSSMLGTGLVAPVSPYKPGHAVFPLPPAGISYPGSLAGAYAAYPQPFLPPGMSLEHAKSSSQLLSAQFAACSKAGTSPLAGASPPSLMSAGLCRDPYCLSYHCASHLSASSGANCAHDAASALKSGYPLVYSAHPLHGVPSSAPSFGGHPLYPYGFVLPNDPLPHVCNWVSANGACDKRFSSSEELLGHLRTHTAFAAGSEKLLSGYPGSSSLAAAMACHMHMTSGGSPSSPGALAMRGGPHHPLGLGGRYHPYSKSPLPAPGAPVPVPAATGPYYSPYALYGQRLTTASALGYQ
ncbi:zinc finger protein 503-like [Hippocampus zosterae]|uniref:zinc finger protein 503-like n=1 Tax=Hippocampus zosterae TaxID=109293 RepID=UPI00223CA172|nr:zinc finger protein 503-like [Hippocampus zosterae]